MTPGAHVGWIQAEQPEDSRDWMVIQGFDDFDACFMVILWGLYMGI
jgi:hypothetical protein